MRQGGLHRFRADRGAGYASRSGDGPGRGALTYSFLENGVEKTGECLLSKTGEDKRLQALIKEGRLLTVNSAEPNMNASRTYKLLILTAVFVFFGLMSPLAAKYMPQMLASGNAN